MKKTYTTFLILVFSLLTLSGCNEQTPEKVTGTNKRVDRRTSTKIEVKEEVVPMLKVDFGAGEKDFKLRSQIASYVNGKGEMIIMLADTKQQSCTQKEPALNPDEKKIVITLKTEKADTPVDKAKFMSEGDGNTFKAELVGADAKEPFSGENIGEIEVTYINESVIRGNIKMSDETKRIDGEFFAAVCK